MLGLWTAGVVDASDAEQQALRYRELYERSKGNALSRLQVEEAEAYQRVTQARLNRERRHGSAQSGIVAHPPSEQFTTQPTSTTVGSHW